MNTELWTAFLSGLKVEKGRLAFRHPEGKWYNEEALAGFLAPFVTEGRLIFRGEDGTEWGFHFDAKGGVNQIAVGVQPSVLRLMKENRVPRDLRTGENETFLSPMR